MAKRRKPYIYEYVKVLAITDGDTFDADIDLGGRGHSFSPVRLKGVNTKELKSKVPADAALALRAKEYLASILPIGIMLRIESKRLDKYGRFESIVTDDKGRNINDLVLTSGYATKA